MKFCRRSGAIAAAALMALSAVAEAQRPGQPVLVRGAVERVLGKAPDSVVALRVALVVSPGWHVGAQKPGTAGVATEFDWSLPPGWRLLDERWPTPATEVAGRDTMFTYAGSFGVDARLARSTSRRQESAEVVVSYVVCKDVCIPGRLTLKYEHPNR